MSGVAASTLSNVLQGSYKSDPGEILKKAERAISEWYRRKNAPGGKRFVTTRVAKEIFGVVRATSKLGGIGMLTGPSGIGKTKALAAVVESDYPNAVLFEVNAGCSSQLYFLRAVLRYERVRPAMRAKGEHQKIQSEGVVSIAQAFNRAVVRLADSGRMIIADEADGLSNATFGLLRQLHDSTGCPVLLCGRPPLQGRVLRTQRDESIGGSLVGRLCVNHRLEPRSEQGTEGTWWFTTAEIVDLLQAYKLTFTPDAARWLAALANATAVDVGLEAGGLRYAVSVLVLAMTMMQGGDGEVLTAPILKEANRLLRGGEWSARADRIANAMKPVYSATA